MKLFFAVFSIALLLSISGCVAPPRPPEGGTDYFKDAVFTPAVKGCASLSKSADIREMPQLPQDFNEKAPKITFDGNTITYSRAIQHQCCRTVEITTGFSPGQNQPQEESKHIVEPTGGVSMSQMIQMPVMVIYENWSGDGCRCMCSSEITAKVENLKANYYRVQVIERGTNPDGTTMEEKTIINKDIFRGESKTEGNSKSCSADSDCVLVDEGCCNCNSGGKRTAINKNFMEQYNENLEASCKDTACPAVISDDPSCAQGTTAGCMGVPPNATCYVQPEGGYQQPI